MNEEKSLLFFFFGNEHQNELLKPISQTFYQQISFFFWIQSIFVQPGNAYIVWYRFSFLFMQFHQQHPFWVKKERIGMVRKMHNFIHCSFVSGLKCIMDAVDVFTISKVVQYYGLPVSNLLTISDKTKKKVHLCR